LPRIAHEEILAVREHPMARKGMCTWKLLSHELDGASDVLQRDTVLPANCDEHVQLDQVVEREESSFAIGDLDDRAEQLLLAR
jgi:hypothetical protein